MEVVARPFRALKRMLPMKTTEVTTARMVTLSHRDKRATSMAELSAWSNVVLGDADDRAWAGMRSGVASRLT